MGPESEISGSLKYLEPEKIGLSKIESAHSHPSNTLVPIYLAHDAMDLSPIALVENK